MSQHIRVPRAARRHAVPIGEVRPRIRARVCGTVMAVTYRAAGKNPRLIARLTDETGSVDLIFQGQRTIRGIEPGRALIATGTVFDDGGAPVMFNPEYRLLPAREEYAS